MIEFRLVDIGEGLTQAEIVRWLVAVGDRVSEDEPVVEIETDKAVVEMPAPATGTVVALGGDVGDVVAVGEILVVIDDGSASEGRSTAPNAVEPETNAPAPAVASLATPATIGATPATRPLATPSTRALARRLGVDLGSIRGSGPGGRIMDDDVTSAAANAPGEPASGPSPEVAVAAASEGSPSTAAPTVVTAGTRIPLRGIRKRTAESMTAAWQAVPHVDSFHEVDVTDLFSLRSQFNEARIAGGSPVTLTACFVKATALALAEHPMLNSSIDTAAGEIVLHADRHIGIAVDTPDGLVLPVVRNADQRSLPDIAAELAQLGEAATSRRLTPAQMSGATFTLSNHGVFGGWFGTSLVHGSEVGIAGFGPARRRPEFDSEGRVVPRRILVVNLAADHRVVDGRDIINFGMAIRRQLEAPLALFLGAG